MRTNNGKVRNVIISLYFILIVLAIIATTLWSSFNEFSENPSYNVLIIVLVFAILFLITHRVSRYFEYDSDGVQVVIINRGLLLSDHFNYREHKVEFDKDQLKGYNFRNYLLYKTLDVYIADHKGRTRKEQFNVTLVGRKRRKYIRQSLSKIVKHNKKENA